jgi:hypothetical protein
MSALIIPLAKLAAPRGIAASAEPQTIKRMLNVVTMTVTPRRQLNRVRRTGVAHTRGG